MASKITFTFLLIVFSSLIAISQINYNYKPGIVISNDNDTVWGLIKDRGSIRNATACYFKKDKESKPEKFLPYDITAYMFGDKFYQSAEIFSDNEYKQLFIEVLIKGKVSLYYNRKDEERSFYIQKDDSEMLALTNEITSIRNVSGSDYAVPVFYKEYDLGSLYYMDTLLYLFKGSKITPNQIYRVEYEKEPLMNITKDYVEETYGPEGIYYIKNLKSKPYQFGVYSGLSINEIFFLNKSSASSTLLVNHPLGIFYYIPLSLINDRFILQTELNTSQTKFNQHFSDSLYSKSFPFEYRQVGVIFLLKYEMFQKKIISPSVAFGKNTSFVASSDIKEFDNYAVHMTQKGGWFLEMGLNYKLSSRISLFSSLRFHSLNSLVVHGNDLRLTYNAIKSKSDPLEFKTNVGSVLIGLKF